MRQRTGLDSRRIGLPALFPEDPAEPVWEASQVVEAGRTAQATGVAQDGGAATSEANTILMGARDPGFSPREVEDDEARHVHR